MEIHIMLCRLVVLIAATLSIGGSVAVGADVPVKVVEEIAAKINGDIITRGELEKKRLEIASEARRQGLTGTTLESTVTEYSANALRDEIDTLLLVQRGKDLNINVDADGT